jgi:hypothetical protein
MPIEPLDANSRIIIGRAYLAALERSFRCSWFDQYRQFQNGKLELVEQFALIHPSHYENNDPTGSVRGPREFSTEVGIQGIACEARLVWGYPCDRLFGDDVAADHLFPFSFGGPTVGSNKIHLCQLHNQVKGSDIHLYPWERGEPPWLRGCIEAIKRIKGDGPC